MKVSGAGASKGAAKNSKTKSTEGSKAKSSDVKLEKLGGAITALAGTDVEYDSVEVGDHLETIDLIKNLVAGSPDIRTDQVDRIVRELKSGKYKINFEKVAEGFIKDTIIQEIANKPRKKV